MGWDEIKHDNGDKRKINRERRRTEKIIGYCK